MKKLLFIATVLISLTACKKDQTERNLYSKGGTWNIKNYSWSQGPTSTHTFADDSHDNCGTMNFNKNGSGKLAFNFNGSTNTTSFTYSIDGDKLTMVADGETIVYDLDWSKNAFTIKYYRPQSADGEIPYKSKKFICEKK